jgi:glycosyl-4,4'-diaponeurosporenoate acyltransferase
MATDESGRIGRRRDAFQSVWYRLALLVTVVYLTAFWFVLGPSSPLFALMLVVATSSLQPILAGPLMRHLPRQCFRVPDGERVLYRVLGVGRFWWLLDVIGWNRLITRMRAFSGTKAGLVALEQSARAGAVAHAVCFAIHVALAILALSTNHPWSGALWMLLPAIIPHFYPVFMQRSILLRLQPLLDNATARRPIAD